ncbi:MAG TPA: hypothetical protein VFF67_05895 [Thermoplasmata archaeon]|nr:hypothetical protein [Thermoplasmata archaeon]
MRGAPRTAHPRRPGSPFAPAAREEETDENRFIGRECYVFNPQLRSNLNDTRCSHCRFYLTAKCPHIDEFLDDVEDLMPD